LAEVPVFDNADDEEEFNTTLGQRGLQKAVLTGTVIRTPKEARTRRMVSYGGTFN